MAGGQERILRRRIKSVQSTKKITKAMELIAASRIVKAQQRVAAARPYAEKITAVIGNLAAGGAGMASPLLTPRESVSKVAFVAVCADRGLAGAYNTNVIRATERAILATKADGKEYGLICVGKKAEGYFRFRGYTIDASFTGMSDQPGYEDARRVAAAVTEHFESGKYDQVELVYTQFLSAGTQRVAQRRFMPIDSESLTATIDEGPTADYEFEPSPGLILERLLPRYAEARLFAAMLEAAASEHAARQRAMKSATDNAEELITKLSRIMNRARQDAITTEIMEIVGGAEAQSQSSSSDEDTLIDHIGPQEIFPQHRDRRHDHV